MKRVFLMIFLLSQPVLALEVREVDVFSERDTETLLKCQVTSGSATAAVEAALRGNRIRIDSKSQLNFYIQLTGVEISSGGGCAVVANLSVYYLASVPVTFPSNKKTILATVELCRRLNLLTGPKYDLQSRVNSALSDLTNRCVSDIERM